MASRRVNRRAAMIPPPGGYTNHMPATILAGDTRTDAERAETKAAYDLWIRDLEHIRRARPLLNSTDVMDITTGLQKKKKKKPGPIEIISLVDDDGDEGSKTRPAGGSSQTKPTDSAPPPPVGGRDVDDFYGMTGEPVSYQIRSGKGLNQYPSPGLLRFDMSKLRKKLKWKKRSEADVAAIVRQQLWGTADSAPQEFERSLRRNWLRDFAVGTGPRLVKGLPMMEDVVFLRAGNYQGIASNCFWKAVAYHVYGDHSFDVRVKAEHLEYFSEVLRWPQHPKYTLYTEMNKRFHRITVQGDFGEGAKIAVNLYQMMTIPCTYTSGDLFEITADLYRLFITVYEIYRVNSVEGQPTTGDLSNVEMWGSYNDRHVFILFLGDPEHYQPIVPNEFYASEFRQPRPTNDRTYGYPPGLTRFRRDELSTNHRWRVGGFAGGSTSLIDKTTAPPPVIPFCDENWIEAVVNGSETDVAGA